jgi:agmatinase
VPYAPEDPREPSAAAVRTVREQSLRFADAPAHWDFTFGGELFAGRDVRIVDCGDVAMVPGDLVGNAARTTAAVRAVVDRGAFPLVLGGDDSIPIPVLRAWTGYAPMCVVAIDAHIDWRAERFGIRDGLSSNMRRASEIDSVTAMAQIGIRGGGSARREEVEAARAFGSVIVTAAELRRDGPGAALARIPAAERYYLSIDIDGLDPAIAPGVLAPAFGGVSYEDAGALVRGIAAKGRLVGFDVVEIVPEADVHDRTSLLGARLALDTIAALAWTGQLGR